MDSLRLIAVGRLRTGPELELFERYNDRLRPKLVVAEISEARGAVSEIKRREADGLLNAITRETRAVVLDASGPSVGSEGLARSLETWLAAGRPVAFLIGGAEGLAASVLERADHVLSLGPLTWPHMLVRAMLAEQLYRAQCIAGGHPYHRAGRP